LITDYRQVDALVRLEHVNSVFY